MKKVIAHLSTLAVLCFVLVPLTGCPGGDDAKDKVDSAVDNVKEGAEKAGDKAKEMIDKK